MRDIIQLVLALGLIGFLVWLFLRIIPMSDPFPVIIKAIAGIAALLLVLRFFGLIGGGLHLG